MRKHWNLILPAVVVCIVIVVVVLKYDELGEFAKVVSGVRPLPFIIAFMCLFGRYLSHAFAYKGLFKCVGEQVAYPHIVPLVFSVTFANDCAPTAGTAGSVLLAAWAHKQGMDMGKSVSVVFLEKVGYFGGFAVVMLVGFGILLATGQMQWYLLLGCLAMLLMIGFVGTVLVLGYGHEAVLVRLFAWIERCANRVLRAFKRSPLSPWSERVAASFHTTAVLVVAKPVMMVATFIRFVMAHAFDCACFVATGFAFGFTQIPFLIAGYVAGFVIATFILQTIGAVEVLIALLLGVYGVPPAVAAAIALCYRGLIFWVPFAIGAVCVNFTGRATGALTAPKDVPDEAVQGAQGGQGQI